MRRMSLVAAFLALVLIATAAAPGAREKQVSARDAVLREAAYALVVAAK